MKEKKYLNFSKFSGQGNDFIIIDATKEKIKLSKIQIVKMCDRHFGIGADGLILVKSSKVADFYMDYYNRDGSTAEMCGNGIRCMAYFLNQKNITNKNLINIETLAGIKKIELKFNTKTGLPEKIKVNMGTPNFEPEKIPVVIKINDDTYAKNSEITNIKDYRILNYPVVIDGNEFKINCVSMGNPHCVIFLDNNLDIEKIPIDVWGPRIENYKFFPKKTNVEFVKIESSNKLAMRVWERGVGETLACGTGACAAAVCFLETYKNKESKVIVNIPGGKLNIYWKGNDLPVYLEGGVIHIFDGKYYI